MRTCMHCGATSGLIMRISSPLAAINTWECHNPCTPTATPMSLLDDPATVALLRDLYAHARHVGARHGKFGWAGLGGRVADWQHVWTNGIETLSVEDGWLTYKRRTTVKIRVAVTSVREAVQLLATIGALPERFAKGGAA